MEELVSESQRDSRRTNAVAPELPIALSDETQARIAAQDARHYHSPYATADAQALRRYDDQRDEPTPLRPAFLRDVEKIIHAPAYNRLAGKTQVFSFRADDDLSRRGLHVQLVSRVARDIGRALGLNIDLIEAIALGHDIGHTPFGHAGERFLNRVYKERTGRSFSHNLHSVRVLDVLYGRNLTLQTLDGILCHNGECERRVFETQPLPSFDVFDDMVEQCRLRGSAYTKHLRPSTLEGCVVRISDIIAYVGKDRQDAIRARHVTPDAFDDGLGGVYNSWALDAFISDVVEHSLGTGRIEMSEAGFAELARAKRENYQRIYLTNEVNGQVRASVGHLFEQMYNAAMADLESGDERTPIMAHHVRPMESEAGYYGRVYAWQDDLDQTVVDFIASMTDDYFVAYAERLNPEAAELFPARSYFADLDGDKPHGDWA